MSLGTGALAVYWYLKNIFWNFNGSIGTTVHFVWISFILQYKLAILNVMHRDAHKTFSSSWT